MREGVQQSQEEVDLNVYLDGASRKDGEKERGR